MASRSTMERFHACRDEKAALQTEKNKLVARVAGLEEQLKFAEQENARLQERIFELESTAHKSTQEYNIHVSLSPPRSPDDEEEWPLWTGTVTSDKGVESDSEDSNSTFIPEKPRVLKRKFKEEADDTNDKPIDVGDKHKEDTESAESKHNEPDTCRVPQTDPPVVINTLDSSSFVPTITL
jgi:hypothetical protein